MEQVQAIGDDQQSIKIPVRAAADFYLVKTAVVWSHIGGLNGLLVMQEYHISSLNGLLVI